MRRVTRPSRSSVLAPAALALLLALPAAPLAAQDRPTCADAVQGKIAWNDAGATRWNPRNVERLCAGAEGSREPAACFRRVKHGDLPGPGDGDWSWQEALELCRGTQSASTTVRCYEERRRAGGGGTAAVEACRWEALSRRVAEAQRRRAREAAKEDGDGEQGGGDGGNEGGAEIVPQVAVEAGGHTLVTPADVIQSKYEALGGPGGRLGTPDGPVRTNPDGTGQRRRYEHGHIYWHPDTGAHPVYDGPIWRKWKNRRWEQGRLGYPVADPEPLPGTRGRMQRFQGGRLVAFGGRRGGGDRDRLWEVAGRSDFEVRPRADAERCVADVPAAFGAIEFGRRSGRNFVTHHVGREDVGDRWGKVGMGGHMQGVARLPGGWLAQAQSKGVFLTHFPGQDGSGHDAWAGGPSDGVPVFPGLPAVERKHLGGLHAHGDVLVVPSDHRVEIFRHRSGALELLTSLDVSEHQKGAHFASILPLEKGDWLLAVGRDSRKRRKAHRVHFYVLPRLDASQAELRYLGRRGRGNTRRDFQSGSLLADCDGRVYFLGTGVRVVQANTHAKLYRVDGFARSGGGRPDRVDLTKVAERAPDSERNDCSLNAAATFFPTADRKLAMYCTEKEIRNGRITTREYRDEGG